ncbi:hypothetical protein PUR71_38165 [Streptomyces sp. SP17BM10]|nr:hypothetical protein [Streptomyces sp. SP17BM10]MEE1788688.1 hypothetical protein [Streptomyces sp. SP17BM10]
MRINQGRTAARADTVADRLPASAWHRHITLAMLALAFLAALAADTTPARPTRQNRHVRSTDPIDLTVPEIRHLLGALLDVRTTSPHRLLHWSSWHRHHQAAARRSHNLRRIPAPIA